MKRMTLNVTGSLVRPAAVVKTLNRRMHSEIDKEIAHALFGSAGYAFWTASDGRLDAVTAISESGPGDVFHFLEASQAAAQSLGFAPNMARTGVEDSAGRRAAGAAGAIVWRLDKAGAADLLKDAVHAACERSKEINAASSLEADAHDPGSGLATK